MKIARRLAGGSLASSDIYAKRGFTFANDGGADLTRVPSSGYLHLAWIERSEQGQ